MIRPIKWIALMLCLALGSCATDTTTFLNYGNPKSNAPPPTREQLLIAPAVSDGLAINYANSVEVIMRCKATQNRIEREVSATAQVALAAFAGAGAALGYGTNTLTALGLGSAGIPQLQSIFDAKGRAEAYNQAAEIIHDGVLEYYGHNSTPSSAEFTPNGLTLVKKVSAAINLVNDTIAGHLPSRTVMLDALEPMSPEGTQKQNPEQPPVNAIQKRVVQRVAVQPPVIPPPPPDTEQLISTINAFLKTHVTTDENVQQLNQACDIVNRDRTPPLLTKSTSTDPKQARLDIEGQVLTIKDPTQLRFIKDVFATTIKRGVQHVVVQPPVIPFTPPETEQLISTINAFLETHVTTDESVQQLNQACDILNRTTPLLTKSSSTDPKQARLDIEGQVLTIKDPIQLRSIKDVFTTTIK